MDWLLHSRGILGAVARALIFSGSRDIIFTKPHSWVAGNPNNGEEKCLKIASERYYNAR